MKRAFCMGVSVCVHRHLAYRLLHFNFPRFCSPQQPFRPCAGRLTSPNVREHVTELHCRFLHALQCYVECSKTVTQGTDRSPLKVSIYLMQSRGMPD